MWAFFLVVLCVPMVFAAGSFIFFDGITVKEFGVLVLLQFIVAGSSAGIVSCTNTHDTEVWNGRVASKERNEVSCSHSYPCNCRSVSCGKNCSTTVCDTCYMHSYDVDWDVYTTNKEDIEIDRVDLQGVVMPARWRDVKVGDETSVTHGYDNYIKAAPGTLFKHQGNQEKYLGQVPAYPQDVYDYYRLNRLVQVGVDVPDAPAWNGMISYLNSDMGAKRQSNTIVVLVKDKPQDYYYALEEAWVGGKKNDIVLVVDVDSAMKPQWAQVMCWTSNEMFRVKLSDDIMALPVITRDNTLQALREDIDGYYVRKPMKDFEYLKSSITPSVTEWLVTLFIGIIVAGIGIVFMQQNDVFGDEYRYLTMNRRIRNRSKSWRYS